MLARASSRNPISKPHRNAVARGGGEDVVGAVLDLARRFGPIWPQTPQKTGYRGTNGSRDATQDEATIRRYWTAHPEAVPALMTGAASGIVVLDIDIKGGRNGLDSLELLGVVFHPATPTAHSPSGGLHMLFQHPGRVVPSSIDKIAPGLEVKGDGGWITLPPGPGRFWDPVCGRDTPLLSMPDWMMPPEPAKPHPAVRRPIRSRPLSPYAAAALEGIIRDILDAPAGAQRDTMNSEAFSLGGLVAGGVIPANVALSELEWVASKICPFDPRRPWRPGDVKRVLLDAYVAGQKVPREIPRG
ncbi:MAG: bifunctional DNA primase/polymerase [Stellaceae bacterium]